MSHFKIHLDLFAQELDNFLNKLLNDKIVSNTELKDSILYSSIGSGKRLRGYLSWEISRFFYANEKNSNAYGSAHGGALMALADYTMCSSAMQNRHSLVTTVSFHSEFLAPAEVGSLLIIRANPTKIGKSLGFIEGEIKVANKEILNFGGVVKILKT